MINIKGISSSNLSFTKSCCSSNQKPKNPNIIFASLKQDSFKKNTPSDIKLSKLQVKNDLATRIIALQQQMIEDLQNKIRA